MAGNVKGITIEFRGETTKLQSAINSIRKESKSLDTELKAIDRSLRFNPKNVDLWKQKQTALTQAIEETDKHLKELQNAQKQMQDNGVDETSAEYRELEREIIKTENQMKRMNAELKKIPKAEIRAAAEALKEMGEKAKQVGKNLTTHVTAPLVAVGAVGAAKFAEVDKTMQLTNATMGNTAEQAELLDQAMKEAAGNSTFGMNDAATATLNFARAGLSAEQAAAALAPAMNLAAGEGGNLDTVSAGLVATINGFVGSFDDAAYYADIFANACNNSALDIDSLSSSMSTAAPVFKALGYNVDDAALYMGIMADNGIEASEAANALKSGFARLLPDAKGGAYAMQEFGWSILDADGKMKDTVTIQKELHDAFAGMTEDQKVAAAQTMFGTNQYSKWLALIESSPEKVNELSEALENEGTTAEMAEAMMGGFGGSLEKLKSSLDVAATSLGEALAPIIMTVADGIQKLVDWFNNLSPSAQKVIAVVGTLVAAIGPVLVIVGTLMTTVGNMLIMGPIIIGAIGGVVGALGGVVAAVGPVILIIGALIAAGVLLYKHWDEIKAWAITTWETIKSTVVSKVEALRTGLIAKWEAIKTTVVQKWNEIKNAIVQPIEQAQAKVKAIIDKIKSIFPISVGKIFTNLKVPTINVSGGKAPFGIGGMGKKPSISVSWHAQGGIFDRPTLLTDSRGGVHGLGEHGAEAIMPLDPLWDKLDRIAEATATAGDITVNVYAGSGDAREIAEEVKRVIIKEVKNRRLAWQ